MGGKTKTFLIILGMIGVYFIALNAILGVKTADLNPEAVRGTPSDGTQSGSPAPVSQEGLTGELAVGSIVTLGSYEQDSDFSNGKEPLEWDVIGQKGDAYLLITHYVIDCKKFDDGSSDKTIQANEAKSASQATWEKSSIRNWLNGDFYAEAFTKKEQSMIQRVTNRTSNFLDFDTGYLGFATDAVDSRKVNSIGGNDTEDSVFLLSYEEFEEYFQPEVAQNYYKRMQCGKAIVSPTEYARSQGIPYRSLAHEAFCMPSSVTELAQAYIDNLQGDVSKDYEENGYICSWLTRSPGCYTDGTAVLMIISDYTCFSPSMMKNEANGIRPAIWVKG